MGVKVTYTGVKEIDDVLRGMPDQLTDKVLQAANTSAAKYLVDKAKSLAPEGPNGYLVDSIGVVKGNYNQVVSLQRAIGSITVGPRRGGGFKGWAAHLIEYGTRERYTQGKGKIRRLAIHAFRGLVSARPFMLPAFNATKDLILNSINQEIGKKLIAFMKKTVKS